jgi:RimJ/RimL family protein N-acetyltransferase
VRETIAQGRTAFRARAVLKDGTAVSLRPVASADREELIRFFSSLSPRSVYLRFFRPKQRLTDVELNLFTDPDFENQVGLAVISGGNEGERVIALGHYAMVPDSVPRRAEVHFAVADAFQGRGIGSLLLRHLAAIAGNCGIEIFEAFVLPGNTAMMAVFQHSGFPVAHADEAGILHVTFPLAGASAPAGGAGSRCLP